MNNELNESRVTVLACGRFKSGKIRRSETSFPTGRLSVAPYSTSLTLVNMIDGMASHRRMTISRR